MYLERIEIQGFKSFADKTTIEFDKGVTAVVGPNGSGKSNLSEAIKWVLGEQSAKSLRGKKMNDIIFAGSQTRKPINIAEVTLVLNNEDGFLPVEFSQVQITRRINRNGESDCFINKKPCRLKDIVNLFMDSGLGKDSFSIISQGKVETIFHNKPEDRRGMFEEVAGVLKYKTRKSEASRKLERTQENLDRVEDILFEIEKQLAPLEKQKEKALLYRHKKQALSHVEIALIVAQVQALMEQLTLAKQELEQTTKQLVGIRQETTINEEQLFNNKIQLNQTEMTLASLQEKYVTTIERLEKVTSENRLAQERLNFSTQTKEQQNFLTFEKDKEKQELEEIIEQLTEQRVQRVNQVEQLSKILHSLKQEEQAWHNQSEQIIEEQRQHYIDALQHHTQKQNELLGLTRQTEQLKAQLNRLNEQKEDVSQLKNKVSNDVEKVDHELSQVKKSLTQALETYEEKKRMYHMYDDQLHQQQAKEQDIRTKLAQLEAKKHSLEELNDDFAGYYHGVRAILKAKTELVGVVGSLAELINVPKEYVVAIDIALGASLQNIVVTDEKAAKQAIAYLKEKRLGRATFLPVSVIKERLLPENVYSILNKQTGFVGVANQLVKTDKTYQAIVSNHLGHTIIAKNIDSATQIAKAIAYRYKIVTLDGEVIHTGGSMTGGATQQKTQSLLSRQAILKELSQEIRQSKDRRQEILNAIRQHNSHLEELKLQLDDLQKSGAKQRQLETDLTVSKARLSEEYHHIEKRYNVLCVDSEYVEKEQETALTEITRLKQEINETTEVLAQAKQNLERLSASQEDKTAQLALLQPKIQEHTTQLALTKEQESVIVMRLSETKEKLNVLNASLSALAVQQNEELQTSAELQQTITETSVQIKQLSLEKEQIAMELTTHKQTKQQLEKTILSMESVQKDLQKQLENSLKQEGLSQTKIERYNVTVDNHLERLSQEYELTYEAANQLEALEMSVQEAVTYVSTIKREIEQIGPVNMTAIEEYDTVLERFTTMTEQQQDLLQAKEQLVSTMLEMDDEMTKRFKHTFFAIKAQFEKTFPKLFGGGRATLELTDPTNLLESGIDIIAQPPGKKLQNLSLLSGGEKAFTAIALLFAILEVKPVPFCLLDEVEAALDEANVGRYGRYLKSFVDNTQFIVITHRKGTMEESDVLYGVTMQESGVSKLASVKFEDYEE